VVAWATAIRTLGRWSSPHQQQPMQGQLGDSTGQGSVSDMEKC